MILAQGHRASPAMTGVRGGVRGGVGAVCGQAAYNPHVIRWRPRCAHPNYPRATPLESWPSAAVLSGGNTTDTRNPRPCGPVPSTNAAPCRRTISSTIAKPKPVFTKLDPSVVEEELERLVKEADAS